MTSLEQLEALTTLAAKFKDAVEEYTEVTPGVQDQIIDNFKDGEMDNIVELVQEIAFGGLSAMFGSVSEELLLLNVKVCELTCEHAGRVIDQDTLQSFLPGGLKTADSVAELKAAGAPKLAALCKATL